MSVSFFKKFKNPCFKKKCLKNSIKTSFIKVVTLISYNSYNVFYIGKITPTYQNVKLISTQCKKSYLINAYFNICFKYIYIGKIQ